MKNMDQKQKLKDFLPEKLYKLLMDIGRVGEKMDSPVYLVGGIVRDLMLGRKTLDVDVVVEGDGIKFARRLERDLGAVAVTYEKFRTASLMFKKDLKIDVATARTELYKSPAALPEVRESTIEKDLYRRDFTMNAMALKLIGPGAGEVLDLYNGMMDIKSGTVRVLHDRSFIDDPTRIFRAVRYEQRYSFKMDGKTEGLLKHAVKNGYIEKLRGYRLRNELVLILGEEAPGKPLRRMRELGLLEHIHPDIKLSNKALGRMKGKPAGIREKWLFNLLVLTEKLSETQKLQMCKKLSFNKKYINIIIRNS